MCGRHACTLAPENLSKAVGAKGKWLDSGRYMPSYNIGPGRSCPVLKNGKNGRELCCMSWGFNCGPSNFCINARSETLSEKRSFKNLVKGQRCVVVSQGFYEWKKLKGARKQPYFFTTADKKKQEEKIMYFAAVYTTQATAAGPSECFTIITVPAHKSLQSVHDRMPAVIDPELLDVWLGGDEELAMSLLTPHPLHFYPVSHFVSAFGNDGPECLKQIEVKEDEKITKWTVKKQPGKKEELDASPVPVKSERKNLKRSLEDVASPAPAACVSPFSKEGSGGGKKLRRSSGAHGGVKRIKSER